MFEPSLFPAKECPPGLVYSDCASPCPATCQSLHQPVTCPADCVTGCQCPPGRVLQDGRCVEPAACQCEYNHIRFNNTAVIQIGCNKWYVFMGRGVWLLSVVMTM
ncbi:hypothetical protein DPMN_105626 [Dreissena polymorpha]|uniref:TIL domain-containing protein n=1 Tax=Dreissena polymorpha TaxID=45954 RepID=A0A9D4K3I7_DREPO|nr:hypothetical protein DPMN_105626 [Dreissena polymorpha]